MNDEIFKLQGSFISYTVELETSITFAIYKYLSPMKNERLFIDEILLKMGFDRKIQLLNKIIDSLYKQKTETITLDFTVDKFKKTINRIKEIRNKFAHNSLLYPQDVILTEEMEFPETSYNKTVISATTMVGNIQNYPIDEIENYMKKRKSLNKSIYTIIAKFDKKTPS